MCIQLWVDPLGESAREFFTESPSEDIAEISFYVRVDERLARKTFREIRKQANGQHRDGNRRGHRGAESRGEPQKVQFDTKSTLLRLVNNPVENNGRFYSNFRRIASVFPPGGCLAANIFRRSTLFLPMCRAVCRASCLST